MSILTARLDLRASTRTPRAARHVVGELLTAWSAGHYGADAGLIVSELVTNVVDHVGDASSLVVELSLSDGSLRLSVADGSTARPVLREPSDREPRGRGIQLVAMLANRWGCEADEGGKRIWAELGPRS